MTLERVRSYAVKTANELGRAGRRPDRLTVEIVSSRLVEERVGLFRRLTTRTVEDRTQTHIEGWCLWRQQFSNMHIRRENPRFSEPFEEGWDIVRQIWLVPDGSLRDVALRTGRWAAGGGPQLRDQLISNEPATDAAIKIADRAYHDHVPLQSHGRSKSGQYEVQIRERRVPPLDEGLWISRALTALRKKAGTYPKGRPRADSGSLHA